MMGFKLPIAGRVGGMRIMACMPPNGGMVLSVRRSTRRVDGCYLVVIKEDKSFLTSRRDSIAGTGMV